jgi:hypothetical protein
MRMCIDLRGLNEIARMDAYPLPSVDLNLDDLKDASFYTHLDLACGFWQVLVVLGEDIHKRAFQVPYGMMNRFAVPFDMCNALATFQRMLNDILGDFLHKLNIVNLDDLCVCNRTLEDHMEHLHLVLQSFKEDLRRTWS